MIKIIINVFSSFNPTNFIRISWILLNIFFLNSIIYFSYLKNSKFELIYSLINNFIKNELNKINNSFIAINLLSFLFLTISIINLLNMIPFSFCFNSILNIFFFLRLILWLSCIFLSLKYFFKNTISHFTPIGCPIYIRFFIVIIELVRILIRPITLSVRISANLLAGHLLIHLLNEFSFFLLKKRFLNLTFLLLIIFILSLLEICVRIIQAYIFCRLVNIYLCENSN